MYKKGIYKILANEPLTASVWRMVLEGDTEWIVRPGQFVNIALEGRYLRRPISVCDCDARTLTLIYKVVGGGTEQMSRMAAGAELDLESITALNDGLIRYPETILFTSHDHQFVQTVADRIIEVSGNTLLDRKGTYDEFLADFDEDQLKKY